MTAGTSLNRVPSDQVIREGDIVSYRRPVNAPQKWALKTPHFVACLPMLLRLAGATAVVRIGELVMIMELHRQGLSLTAIGRQLGIDRKTVRRYIALGLEPPHTARECRDRKPRMRSCRICVIG